MKLWHDETNEKFEYKRPQHFFQTQPVQMDAWSRLIGSVLHSSNLFWLLWWWWWWWWMLGRTQVPLFYQIYSALLRCQPHYNSAVLIFTLSDHFNDWQFCRDKFSGSKMTKINVSSQWWRQRWGLSMKRLWTFEALRSNWPLAPATTRSYTSSNLA